MVSISVLKSLFWFYCLTVLSFSKGFVFLLSGGFFFNCVSFGFAGTVSVNVESFNRFHVDIVNDTLGGLQINSISKSLAVALVHLSK